MNTIIIIIIQLLVQFLLSEKNIKDIVKQHLLADINNHKF